MTSNYNILQRFLDAFVSLGYNLDGINTKDATYAEICTQLIRLKPHVLNTTKANTYFYTCENKKRAFRNFHEYSKGNYGILYKANAITIENDVRTLEEEIFIKIGFHTQKNCIFREAVLQILAQCAFEKYNLSWAIPTITDIMIDNGSDMFSMIPKKDCFIYETFLKNHIKSGIPCYENDVLLFSVIAQLGMYVEILTQELQMTHRDMKCSNVLMVSPRTTMETLAIQFLQWKVTLHTYLRAILIDFGMSCIPQDDPQYNRKIFAPYYILWNDDITPRDGRDLFLFFADLWRNEWIRDSVTENARALFHTWLGDSWTRNLEKYNQYAYERLFTHIGFQSFDCSQCSPKKVLNDIMKEYPRILQIEEYS